MAETSTDERLKELQIEELLIKHILSKYTPPIPPAQY